MTQIYFPLGSFPLLPTSVGEGEEPLHGPAVSRGATTKPAISKNPNDTKHSKWHNLDQGWANPCPSNQLILAIRPASISISISTMLMMMLMPSCNAVRDQILLGRRGTRQITKSHLGKYCSTLSFSLLRAISLRSANIVQQPLVITRWSLLPLPPDPNIVPLLYLAWRLHFYQILSPLACIEFKSLSNGSHPQIFLIRHKRDLWVLFCKGKLFSSAN